MESFEDQKKGNLIIGVNYLDMVEDFTIIKEAIDRIYNRLDKGAVENLHYRPERRKNGERRKEE